MTEVRPIRRPWFIRDVRFSVALASVALSLWAVVQDSVINPDGALYIEVASRIAAGEWQQGFELYNWPFYPSLIAGASVLTGCGLETAAHCLNALFFAMISVAFVSIVKLIGGDRKVLIAAALVVLCYPSVNEQRSSVIRDPGYLACYLLALLLFLNYQREPLWRFAIGWAAAMGAATLFRMEGFVFLVFVPAVLLADRTRSLAARLALCLKAHTVLISAGAALFLLWLVARHSAMWTSLATSRLGEADVLLGAFHRIVSQTLPNKADVLARTLLNEFSASYAPAVIVITTVTILIWESLQTLTLLNVLLVCLAIFLGGLFKGRRARETWVTWTVLNGLILLFIVVVSFHLTGRAGLALALTVMLAAPFGLARLYERCVTPSGFSWRRGWALPAVCLWLAISAADGLLSFSPSKEHIKEAGIWIRENTPETARLFTNDVILAHYAERNPEKLLGQDPREMALNVIRSGQWRSYDLLAVRVRKRHARLEVVFREALRREPVRSFQNSGGDRVLVFRLRGDLR